MPRKHGTHAATLESNLFADKHSAITSERPIIRSWDLAYSKGGIASVRPAPHLAEAAGGAAVDGGLPHGRLGGARAARAAAAAEEAAEAAALRAKEARPARAHAHMFVIVLLSL